MHLRCWFARKMSQFTRFCGVKFLAWKSGCVKFLTNSMSVVRYPHLSTNSHLKEPIGRTLRATVRAHALPSSRGLLKIFNTKLKIKNSCEKWQQSIFNKVCSRSYNATEASPRTEEAVVEVEGAPVEALTAFRFPFTTFFFIFGFYQK